MRLLGVSDFLELIQKGEVLSVKIFTPFQAGLSTEAGRVR